MTNLPIQPGSAIPQAFGFEHTFVGGKRVESQSEQAGSLSPSSGPFASYSSSSSSNTGNGGSRNAKSDEGFDRYRILEEIGRGGCGVVLRAFDQRMQRDVVLKRVLPDVARSRETISRFLNEARITGRLEHPGIVPVHEIGEQHNGSPPFYVMKWLKGDTLAEAIRDYHQIDSVVDQRRKLHELLKRFHQVCLTLAYAHRMGVIHRDLKPTNIMLGQFGETIVLDWGLAKELHGQGEIDSIEEESNLSTAPKETSDLSFENERVHALTRTGTVMGTASYMSPEQARGELQNIGFHSDVFSLGVILYEILSGASPFRTTSIELTLHKVATASFKPLNGLKFGVPRALNAICNHALQLDPAKRYVDAGALALDIDRFLAGDAVTAYREPWWGRVDRIAGKNMVVVRSVFMAMFTVAALSLFSVAKIEQSRRQEFVQRQRAEKEWKEKQDALSREELAHDKSLVQLQAARRSVDAWLIDLSGELQFYPGMESVRKSLLTRAQEYYRANIATAENAPREILEKGMASIRLADVARLELRNSDARGLYETARTVLGPLLSDADLPLAAKVRNQYANSLLGLALCGLESGEDGSSKGGSNGSGELLVESQHLAEEAADQALLAGIQIVQGAGDEIALDSKKTWLRCQQCLGRIFHAQGDSLKGAEFLEPAVRDSNSRFLESNVPSEIRLMLELVQDQARFYQNAKRPDIAASKYMHLIEQYSRRTELSNRPDWLEARSLARMQLGRCFAQLADPRGMVREFDEANTDLQNAWDLLFEEPFFRENLSITQASLAAALMELGEQVRSQSLLRDAIQQNRSLIEREGSSLDRIANMTQYFLALASTLPYESQSEFNRLIHDAQVLTEHIGSKGWSRARCLQLELDRHQIAAQRWAATQQFDSALQECTKGMQVLSGDSIECELSPVQISLRRNYFRWVQLECRVAEDLLIGMEKGSTSKELSSKFLVGTEDAVRLQICSDFQSFSSSKDPASKDASIELMAYRWFVESLGLGLVETSRLEEALSWGAQIVQEYPNHPEVWHTHAWVQWRMGADALAWDSLQRAQELRVQRTESDRLLAVLIENSSPGLIPKEQLDETCVSKIPSLHLEHLHWLVWQKIPKRQTPPTETGKP